MKASFECSDACCGPRDASRRATRTPWFYAKIFEFDDRQRPALGFSQIQPQVRASIYEIPSGAAMQEHAFPFRYAGSERKTRVTYTAVGRHLYGTRRLHQRKQSSVAKAAAVRRRAGQVLVIDQAEKGADTTSRYGMIGGLPR